MSGYPRTIESGGGERLIFLGLVNRKGVPVLEVENRVQPGSGPPMHVHHLQNESLTILSGTLAWRRPGGEPVFAEAGESITFRAGEAHRFGNAGETELRCRGWVSPPDNFEYFLSAIYESTRGNGGKRPDPFRFRGCPFSCTAAEIGDPSHAVARWGRGSTDRARLLQAST